MAVKISKAKVSAKASEAKTTAKKPAAATAEKDSAKNATTEKKPASSGTTFAKGKKVKAPSEKKEARSKDLASYLFRSISCISRSCLGSMRRLAALRHRSWFYSSQQVRLWSLLCCSNL